MWCHMFLCPQSCCYCHHNHSRQTAHNANCDCWSSIWVCTDCMCLCLSQVHRLVEQQHSLQQHLWTMRQWRKKWSETHERQVIPDKQRALHISSDSKLLLLPAHEPNWNCSHLLVCRLKNLLQRMCMIWPAMRNCELQLFTILVRNLHKARDHGSGHRLGRVQQALDLASALQGLLELLLQLC